ncbi:MAG TPA: hypothetical protein DDW65_02930 [Firmicutes bacterium]|jgi:two-component system, sensor histidine kinase YesM|nr:hypothetical protein [Bacillota bacterium]
MNNRISFQTKLMVNYSFFTIALLLALCFGFYIYNAYLFEKNSVNSLYQVVSKTSQQLDNCVNEMDKISIQVISDEDLMRALTNISLTGIADSNDIRILNDALVVKVQAIYRDNIYRTSIFNSYGYYFTSRLYDELDHNVAEKISKLDWVREARKRNGSKYLLLPHVDNWVSAGGADIFSLVRLIRNPGKEVGFIEIQQYTTKLKEICNINDSSISRVMIVDQSGKLVFSKFKTTPQEIQYYTKIIQKTPPQKHTVEIKSLTGASEIISFQPSEYTGWKVIAVQNKKNYWRHYW